MDSVKEICLHLQEIPSCKLRWNTLCPKIYFLCFRTYFHRPYLADLQLFPFDHMIFQSYGLLLEGTTYRPLNFYILLQLVHLIDILYRYKVHMQIVPFELSLPIVKIFLYNTIIYWPVMRKQKRKGNNHVLTRLTVEAKML